mgnify:CR=1 FL=1
MKPWLEPEEVVELTARVRPSAQFRWLKAMGFDHLVKFRTDSSSAITHLILLNFLGAALRSARQDWPCFCRCAKAGLLPDEMDGFRPPPVKFCHCKR